MATVMAKVRKFEYGFKLSIQGKIVGLLLQDMDSMVRTTMAIEREVDEARSIRDAGASDKGKESPSHQWGMHRCSLFLLTHHGPGKIVSILGCYTIT